MICGDSIFIMSNSYTENDVNHMRIAGPTRSEPFRDIHVRKKAYRENHLSKQVSVQAILEKSSPRNLPNAHVYFLHFILRRYASERRLICEIIPQEKLFFKQS
jgi:hypothetical protein